MLGGRGKEAQEFINNSKSAKSVAIFRQSKIRENERKERKRNSTHHI